MLRRLLENLTLNGLIGVFAIYALNLAVLAVVHQLAKARAEWVQQMMYNDSSGHWFAPTLTLDRAIAAGFLLGQFGCLALWLALSKRRLADMAMFLMAVAQLAVAYGIVVGLNGHSSNSRSILAIEIGGVAVQLVFIASLYVLAVIATLRAFPKRAALVLSPRGDGSFESGLTMNRFLIGFAAFAVCLVLLLYGQYSTVGDFTPLIVVSLVALLPLVSLLIATAFRRLPALLTLCCVVSAICALSSVDFRGDENVWNAWLMYFLMVGLPVLWIKIAGFYGYAIRYFDRTEWKLGELLSKPRAWNSFGDPV